MARRFGSKDSYKRPTENYQGRIPGSKDKDARDRISYFLRYEEERLKDEEQSLRELGWTLDYVKELTGEEKDRYYKYRYLGQLLGIIGIGRRCRFRVPTVKLMQVSVVDENLFLLQRIGEGKRKFELRPAPLSLAEILTISRQNKETRLWWQRMIAEFEKLDRLKLE